MPRAKSVAVMVAAAYLIAGEAAVSQSPGPSQSPSLMSAVFAKRIVEAGLTAMGGVAALGEISTITRELEGDRTDVGQGARPIEVSSRYDARGPIPPVVNRSKTTSFRDLRRGWAADHVRYDVFGGQRVSRRTAIGADAGFTAFYDYIDHGLRPIPAAGLQRARISALRRHPEGLLRAAWAAPQNLRLLGTARWEGRRQELVAFADGDGTQLTLFFDAESHRLSKVETLGEDGVDGDIAIETVYEDYRPAGRLVLPSRYIDRRAGVVLDDNRVASIAFDVPAADTLFTPPRGFDVVDLGKPFPELRPLGDGAFAVLGGYNSIFVVFNDYVLVLEAGGSVREAEAVIATIKQTAPGLPIRYVVATHWNHDHLAGIRPYIAEGATIVAPPTARRVIEAAAAADRPLHPDRLALNPRAPVIELLGSVRRVFTDGSRRVEIHDLSPSPHADEMFVGYLPEQRLLFEADLLDILVPGKVGTGGDDTADLERKIRLLGLQVERILPVHGQIGGMQDLQQALARRAVSPR